MPWSASDGVRVLARLRGLPMWAAGWAGDIAWFEFGATELAINSRGKPRAVGEYALHISGYWRWLAASGFQRADADSTPDELALLGADKPAVADVRVGSGGEVCLAFGGGDVLLIDMPEPEAEADTEYWRVFQPTRDTPHIVAHASGIDGHEA